MNTYLTPTTQSQVVHFYYIGKNMSDASFDKTDCTYAYSIATQGGTLDGIEDTMHLMHGSTASAVAAGTTSFGTIYMHNMMSIAKFDISGYESTAKCSGALCQRTLNLKTGDWNDDGTTGDITLNSPSNAYHMALIPSATSQTFNFSANDGTNPVSKSKLVNPGKFYTADGSGASIVVFKVSIPGMLPGEFTVNSSGDKVHFSKGNLQYIGSGTVTGETATPPYWRFATKQWDVIGETGLSYISGADGYNVLTGSATNGDSYVRDLFGWGTTGHKDTRTSASGNQTRYDPYSTAKTASGAGSTNYYGYGPDYDATNKYRLSVEHQSDWGCNTIYAGGIATTTGWRTLSGGSDGEWTWILGLGSTPKPGKDCRTTSMTVSGVSNARFSKVRIEYESGKYVKGLMIYPDSGFEWDETTMGTAPASNNVNKGNADFTSNTYTPEQFLVLENNGVVFLPAAGRREGSRTYDNNNNQYWSNRPSGGKEAYDLRFASDYVSGSNIDRYYGLSVRLVR